jgi:hypothetical protein
LGKPTLEFLEHQFKKNQRSGLNSNHNNIQNKIAYISTVTGNFPEIFFIQIWRVLSIFDFEFAENSQNLSKIVAKYACFEIYTANFWEN